MMVVLEAINGIGPGADLPGPGRAAAPAGAARPAPAGQRAPVDVPRRARGPGPAAGALLVVTVGPGWALAADVPDLALSALLLVRKVRIPARPPRGAGSTLAELREGWTLFAGHHLAVGDRARLRAAERDPRRRLVHPRTTAWPRSTIGEDGWGIVLSAESLGLVAMTFLMLRRRLERPLVYGMVGVSVVGLSLFLLGAHPVLLPLVIAAFLAGAGIELFSLGWNLAMQENIEERLLSRAYSYDMLGSFVAIPIGQLAYGPLGEHFGYRDVLVVSGIVYAAIALLTLVSPAVRNLRRVPVAG